MAEDWKRLGEAVKARRRELRMTRDQMTQLGGPSQPTIWKIESGQGPFANGTLSKVEKALRWPELWADKILDGEDCELPPPDTSDLKWRQVGTQIYRQVGDQPAEHDPWVASFANAADAERVIALINR